MDALKASFIQSMTEILHLPEEGDAAALVRSPEALACLALMMPSGLLFSST